MQYIFAGILLLSIIIFVIGLIKPSLIKLQSRMHVSIAFIIAILISISGVNYFEPQEAKNARFLNEQAVLKQIQQDNTDKQEKRLAIDAANLNEKLKADTQAKEDNAIRDDILLKMKIEVSVDRLIMDSKDNTKVRLVIRNNSGYQIDKMKVKIALKDAAGNIVDNYDGEILQPILAYGVFGDTLWMKAKRVVDQNTNVIIVKYSKPPQ